MTPSLSHHRNKLATTHFYTVIPTSDEVLGIVGGLGPLASAEFLKTIYESSLREREQEAPKVIMYSDPSFPDRTEAILAGNTAELLERLSSILRALSDLGATRTVVCCVTAHWFFDSLPLDLRTRLVSIVDVIFEEVIRRPEKRLLICSTGAREIGLFQAHEHWPATEEYIVLPDEHDQNLIHRLIYQIKILHDVDELAPAFKSLLTKYRVNSFISGCTEMHIVARRLALPGCIDPLSIIAERLAERKIFTPKRKAAN
jgi:aspartate racemase